MTDVSFEIIHRLVEVKKRTGLSKSSIYARMADGSFPASLPLGKRARGWLKSDIDAWIASCAAGRDDKAAGGAQ